MRIGTNIARSLGSNATRGNIWDSFSSETYELPSVGSFAGLYNPRDPEEADSIRDAGRRPRLHRTASLTSIWATAPFLHNNSVGVFVKDPSVQGRMTAFNDAIDVKMLWPDAGWACSRFRSPRSKARCRSAAAIAASASPPARRWTMWLASIRRGCPTSSATARCSISSRTRSIYRRMLRNNAAPDFVLDRGHVFGAGLSDADKWALIEFLKTFWGAYQHGRHYFRADTFQEPDREEPRLPVEHLGRFDNYDGSGNQAASTGKSSSRRAGSALSSRRSCRCTCAAASCPTTR